MISFYHMCAKCERTFHIAGIFDDIGFGREVVKHIDNYGFLGTGFHGGAIFQFTMMRQHDVNNVIDFLLRYLMFLEFGLQTIGRDKDMAK